jgi:hypothetical protein
VSLYFMKDLTESVVWRDTNSLVAKSKELLLLEL